MCSYCKSKFSILPSHITAISFYYEGGGQALGCVGYSNYGVVIFNEGLNPRLWNQQANADPSVISCMHNLSRRLAIALQHEERRCQYLTREAKLMLAIQEEITTESKIQAFTSRSNGGLIKAWSSVML